MNGGFGPYKVIELPGGIAVSQTVTVTWFIILVLGLFAYFATKKFDKVPGKLQNVVEVLVESIYNLTKQTMGEDKMGFAPYVGTLLIFIGIANISGLFGLRPPTADVNTTFALSIITFCMVQYNGLKSNGIKGYFKGFLEPIPILLPINIIGELANPVSLAFRLFGNIVGGVIIMALLYNALGFLSGALGIGIPILQAGIPAVLHIYFDLFAGLLQSFIFAMLTMVFISMAMD
ncbi:F0F1 ATP synthase subunit A [Maledivibacter halophilus]|uniref:ATP synthase subunit a n=1 Tax=Maledivibacter halophilus TaxID=36842 RepID=A0A1T5JYC9_9FIRM|nr:F0F1 ATP synthase subunit A [Maledivibacter halophilus]SKC56355.1 ATP synthase F0 subcomplex A subunit [Maledivibacter halophilus]